MEKQNTYLASKPRYEILDGLRGVAAIMVVFFHIMETYSKGAPYQIINHGYLAVDFFFVLSGFVVGYAYDDRWNKMTTWGFFKRRLVRLHPMVIMGSVMGLLCYYFGQNPNFGLEGYAPLWKVLVCFVMGCLLIPCGKGLDVRGWGETNPLNGPAWSLQFEYIANILYAFIFRKLPNIALVVLAAVAGFCTLDLCLDLNVFGLLTPAHDGRIYTVIGGWSLAPEELYIGFTRLLYPFLSGLLISRIGKFIKVRNSFLWCSILLVLIFSIPCVGGAGSILNGVYNAFTIIVLFPLIVMMGAGDSVKGEKSKKICNFLGEISYPLYITHYPIMYMQMEWAWSHQDAPVFAHVIIAISTVLLSIGAAYAFLKLYDIPVRKWLTEKWLKK